MAERAKERFLDKDLEALRNVRSLATVTLITFDFAIPVDKEKLEKMDQDPDGWKIVTSSELGDFLKKVRLAFGRDLTSILDEINPRLGGSVDVSKNRVHKDNSKISNAITYSPKGKSDGSGSAADRLNTYVNAKRDRLIRNLELNFAGELTIQETESLGMTPIILSFYHEEGRSMVLIKDDLGVVVPEESVKTLEAPTLLFVDTRELIHESFKQAAINIAKKDDTFTVVGLGTHSILPQAVGPLKELLANTSGEVGFSGNRLEVKTLLENWNGAKTLPEFMLETKLRFLLETDGQNGAAVYIRRGENIEVYAVTIPPDKVSKKDTTNGGDDFLGRILAGLMNGLAPEEALNSAVEGTFVFLEERN